MQRKLSQEIAAGPGGNCQLTGGEFQCQAEQRQVPLEGEKAITQA